MSPIGAYATKLQITLRLLNNPRTARQLAPMLGISKPTVYNRIRALESAGVKIRRAMVRDGKKGPLAEAFSIAN